MKFNWSGHEFDTADIKTKTISRSFWVVYFRHEEQDWEILLSELNEEIVNYFEGSCDVRK